MKNIIELLKERNILSEGIEDPGILKAIFTAGGPGSGKSEIASEIFNIPSKSTLSAFGLKVLSSDIPFEKLLAKYGLSFDLKSLSPELRDKIIGDQPDSLRSRAKRIYKSQYKSYKNERIGMIVDGTGDDVFKIKNIKEDLESIGYDSFMVFVNTNLDVAKVRNERRKRKVPEDIVENKWRNTQANIGSFQSLFGPSNFVVIDNSDEIIEKITVGTEMFNNLERKSKLEIDKSVIKFISRFLREPIKNPIGKKWINYMEIKYNIKSPNEPSSTQKAKLLFDPTQTL